MRLVKAMLAVVVVFVALVIPGNGKDDDTGGGDISTAVQPAGGTVPGATSSPNGSPPVRPEPAQVDNSDHIKVSSAVLVFSTPEEVWHVLTTVRRFFMWYPHWGREKNMMRTLAAVGDTVAFYREGVSVGRSVVTLIEPLKELKIVHELKDGGWAGSILATLSRTDGGVELVYEELLPPPVSDPESERKRVYKQTYLIKRLAEGE